MLNVSLLILGAFTSMWEWSNKYFLLSGNIVGDLIYSWATYFRVERQVKLVIYVPSSLVVLLGLFLFPSSFSNGSLYSLIFGLTRRLRFAFVAGLAGNNISCLFEGVLFLCRQDFYVNLAT